MLIHDPRNRAARRRAAQKAFTDFLAVWGWSTVRILARVGDFSSQQGAWKAISRLEKEGVLIVERSPSLRQAIVSLPGRRRPAALEDLELGLQAQEKALKRLGEGD